MTQTGSVTPPGQPAFLATDRSGRFLLSSYYADGKAAVHPLGGDGSVGGAATCVLNTDTGAHSIQTDRSNRYAYVPHIARVQDNVLEPPKNIPGPNIIYQFRFDESSGTLAANDPPTLAQDDMIGPASSHVSPFPGHCVLLQRAGMQRVVLHHRQRWETHAIGNRVHPAGRRQ